MKTIRISVEDDLYAAATAEAAKHRKTVSDWLHDLLAGLQRNRESKEVDQRAHSAGEDDRAALIARLEHLFAEADARDRNQKGSVGPFSREELYAERLDRFR